MDVSGSSEALIVQAIGGTRNKIVSLSAPGAVRLSNEACTPTSIHYVSNTLAIAQTLGSALVARGNDSWFFITVDYSFGYDLERDTTEVVEAKGGKVLGHARHPLATRDFGSYLAQAQESRAKVIGLANAGTRHDQDIAQAAKLGMIGKQTFAGLAMRVNHVDLLGLADDARDDADRIVLLGSERGDPRLVEAVFRAGQEDAEQPAGRRLFIDDALPAGGRQGRHRRDRTGDGGDAGGADQRFLRT